MVLVQVLSIRLALLPLAAGGAVCVNGGKAELCLWEYSSLEYGAPTDREEEAAEQSRAEQSE